MVRSRSVQRFRASHISQAQSRAEIQRDRKQIQNTAHLEAKRRVVPDKIKADRTLRDARKGAHLRKRADGGNSRRKYEHPVRQHAEYRGDKGLCSRLRHELRGIGAAVAKRKNNERSGRNSLRIQIRCRQFFFK